MNKDAIVVVLDAFVASRGTGSWGFDPPRLPKADHLPSGQGRSYCPPIQQLRDEILAFVDVVLGLQSRKTILEIGAGEWCGTHYLWRMLFDKVVTIEEKKAIIDHISYPVDGRSAFLIGDSRVGLLPAERVCQGEVDALFIDGGHDYELVASDYLLYRRLVRKGGVIAFHDALDNDTGVPQFLQDLGCGKVDGVLHEFIVIDKFSGPIGHKVGIAYLKV